MPTYQDRHGLLFLNIWNWSITSCSVITMSEFTRWLWGKSGSSSVDIEVKYSLRAFDLSKGWVIILLFTLIGLDVVFLFLNGQIDLATLYHFPGGIDWSTNVFWSLDKYSFFISRLDQHKKHTLKGTLNSFFLFPKLISML